MTDAHTPGPWTRYEDGLNGEDGLDIIMARIGDENYDIAAICEDQPATVRKANSRLIAAAPIMLDALKDAEQEISDMIHDYSTEDNDGMAEKTLAVIRAAIAAAEGK